MKDSANDVALRGQEHWTHKGEVKLYLYERPAATRPALGGVDQQGVGQSGTILFVHGSSMSSRPTFDLQVPGRPSSSAMDHFAQLGFDTWCVDMEGYGRSDQKRAINCDIANGADDLVAATDFIKKLRGTGKFLVYGISSGALRAALFAQRHPERVARLAVYEILHGFFVRPEPVYRG